MSEIKDHSIQPSPLSALEVLHNKSRLRVSTHKAEVKRKKRRGRPPKGEIRAKSQGGRKKLGRPRGDATIINEYKARMLTHPSNNDLLNKMYHIALDDHHKHQAAVMKLIVDRLIPRGAFEQEVSRTAGTTGIEIVIKGLEAEAKEKPIETVESEIEPVYTTYEEVE